MSSHKKKLILNTVSVDIGCGGRCKKPKLSKIFNPKPIRTKTHCYDLYRSSSTTSSNTNPSSATTFSPTMETPVLNSCYDVDTYSKSSSRMVRGFGRVGGESVAVEKDSDDPYLDFRRSMLQMILEKQIYSKDDLRELLNCFLQLNSPCNHGIIVKAFTEIWNGVFSVKSSGGDGWEKQQQWQQHQHLHYHHHHNPYHHVQQQQQDYYGYGFNMSRDF